MKKDKAREIAKSVLEQVGGKDNVSKVLHCQTRLRFNLKDESVAVDEKLEAIKGDSGIIGTTKKNLDFTRVSLA